MKRRTFLHLAAGATVLPAVSRSAWAQVYPSRPVRIVVGFPPGGSTDIAARLIAERLTERLGQTFIVENRPGAGSNIATETVVHAAPDGYTLLLAGNSNSINMTLYEKLNFDFTRDIVPVAALTMQPQVLLANLSVPATTVPEFIAYAKASPSKIAMASAGNGSIGHLAGELFKIMAGIELVHVPYRGAAPALTDLLAGHVQISFNGIAGSIEHLRAGTLRGIAVTTKTRSDALPEIPSVSEFVPGYEVFSLFGIGAPKKTSAEVVNKLNTEINAALADPKIRARIADLGGTVLTGSPADFGRLLVDETEKWGKVIRSAGIKPE
jgi:tripartite-type tricarboxylate transporter receptor subunit TctC